MYFLDHKELNSRHISESVFNLTDTYFFISRTEFKKRKTH